MGAPSAQPVRDRVGSDNSVVKRRACDECRARKLACTKDPGGCARCKREGVACQYSAQKQMGRPRTRRGAEKAPEVLSAGPAAPAQAPVTAQRELDLTIPDATMDVDPAMLLDSSLADMSFLGLLGPDIDTTQLSQVQPPGPKDSPLHQNIWNFEISFDPHYPPSPADGTETASTQIPPCPGLSTPGPSSQEASPPELAPLPPGSCSCLASLYLALDSLARLPTEVGPAIRVARCALKTAHDAIQCQVCSPPLTETTKLPIATLQNGMVLGALLPTIADAYQRILDLVEAETARGIIEQRQLRFVLSEYGGVWGQLRGCGVATRYADEWMQPAMWRLLVRALLKTDVYGIKFDPEKPGDGGLQNSHLGLKDIIGQMDERSRTRHAEIDAMVEAGLPVPTGPIGMAMRHSHAHGGEEPPCRKIIQIAGEAVDRLVIA